jgi:small subunit ribosomal protein S4e
VYIIGGNNIGRVGTLLHIERHLGSFDISHVKDEQGKTFATRASNTFVIGEKKSLITLPEGDGKYLSILEEKQLKEDKHHKDDKNRKSSK